MDLGLPTDKPVIGWDKDSTLADTSHRQWMIPLIKEGKATWEEYATRSSGDTPVYASLVLMELLSPHYHNVVMSGCNDCPEAREWLVRHKFPCDAVLLRPNGNTTDNAMLKVRWIWSMQASGYNVALFVEDWPETAKVIREQTSVHVLVVNPCYEGDGRQDGGALRRRERPGKDQLV